MWNLKYCLNKGNEARHFKWYWEYTIKFLGWTKANDRKYICWYHQCWVMACADIMTTESHRIILLVYMHMHVKTLTNTNTKSTHNNYIYLTFICTSLIDIPHSSCLNHVPDHKLLYGLVFRDSTGTICAPYKPDMSSAFFRSAIITPFGSL